MTTSRDAVAAEPPELVVGPVRDRIERTLDARHAAAHHHLLDDLTSTRYLPLLAALDRPSRRCRRQARRQASEEGAGRRDPPAATDACAAASTTPSPQRTATPTICSTRSRKAAKRVRYAAESATDTLGSKADKLAERMEAAQETLGTHQDTVVIRDVLRRPQRRRRRPTVNRPSPTATCTPSNSSVATESRAAFLHLVDHGWARRPSWMR